MASKTAALVRAEAIDVFISSREREGTVKSASVKRVTATNRQVPTDAAFREGERGYTVQP